MNNITAAFRNIYLPVKALVVFEKMADERDTYVEAYDLDDNGRPVNAHPLSVEEADKLAEALQSAKDNKGHFLAPKSLLPSTILYLRGGSGGYAIWRTPPQQRPLFFKEDLSIPCGEAWLPALV